MGWNCPSGGTGGCARAVWEGPGKQALAISKNKSPHSDLQPERTKGTPPLKRIQMRPTNTGLQTWTSDFCSFSSLLIIGAVQQALWEGNYLPRSSLNKTRTPENFKSFPLPYPEDIPPGHKSRYVGQSAGNLESCWSAKFWCMLQILDIFNLYN